METLKIVAARLANYADTKRLEQLIASGDLSLQNQDKIRKEVATILRPLPEKQRIHFQLEMDTAMRIDFLTELYNTPATSSVILENQAMNNKVEFLYRIMALYPGNAAVIEIAIKNMSQNPKLYTKAIEMLAMNIPEVRMESARLLKSNTPLTPVGMEVVRQTVATIPRIMTIEEFKSWVKQFPYVDDAFRLLMEDVADDFEEAVPDLEQLTLGWVEFFALSMKYIEQHGLVSIAVTPDMP